MDIGELGPRGWIRGWRERRCVWGAGLGVKDGSEREVRDLHRDTELPALSPIFQLFPFSFNIFAFRSSAGMVHRRLQH